MNYERETVDLERGVITTVVVRESRIVEVRTQKTPQREEEERVGGLIWIIFFIVIWGGFASMAEIAKHNNEPPSF